MLDLCPNSDLIRLGVLAVGQGGQVPAWHFPPDHEVALAAHALEAALVEDGSTLHPSMSNIKQKVMGQPYYQSNWSLEIEMQEMTQYLHRFYDIVIRPIVSDPLVHSQWTYFLSMFKAGAVQRERVELYLSILDKERRSKLEAGTVDSKTSGSSHWNKEELSRLASSENTPPAFDLKIQHKYSEKWQGQLDSFDKSAGERLGLKKLNSEQEVGRTSRPPLQSQEKKAKTRKDSFSYAMPSSSQPANNYPSPLGNPMKESSGTGKSDPKLEESRQKYRKLCDISTRIVGIFRSNCGLRC